MAVRGRIPRFLSYFNTLTHTWEPFPKIVQMQTKPTLTLVSWNLNYFSTLQAERAKLILDRVINTKTTPDIILFQEVHRDARISILDDPKVRNAFLATDAEDECSFTGVKFTTMTLLSRESFTSVFESYAGIEGQKEHDQKPTLTRVERVKLPSAYRRDALSVDIPKSPSTDGAFLRLVNVHLDSLPDSWRNRVRQMDTLTEYLQEPECLHGIIAGDFNTVVPEDEKLIDGRKGLLDAWEVLHGANEPSGHTRGVGAERRRPRPGRLDRVITMNVIPRSIEVLRPSSLRVSELDKFIPWSDHSGLKCTFSIE